MLRFVTRNLQYSWVCYISILQLMTIRLSFNQLSEGVEGKYAWQHLVICSSGLASLSPFVISNFMSTISAKTNVQDWLLYFKYITDYAVSKIKKSKLHGNLAFDRLTSLELPCRVLCRNVYMLANKSCERIYIHVTSLLNFRELYTAHRRYSLPTLDSLKKRFM